MSELPRHLIVFARAPELGRVKTRLAARLGPHKALAIHRELLAHTLAAVARIEGVSPWLCVTGHDPGRRMVALARRHGMRWVAQPDGDLGERMARALRDRLREGGQAVLIGCDCPPIDAEVIRAAFAALAGHDMVFGPTEDGGYALVGARRDAPAAFRGIDWSTARVMGQTRERLAAAGLRWHELPTLWDVDEAPDWRRFLAWRGGRTDSVSTPVPARRRALGTGLAAAGLALTGLLAETPARAQDPSAARLRDRAVEPAPGPVPARAAVSSRPAAQPTPGFADLAPGGALPAAWEVQTLRGIEPNRHRLVSGPGGTVLQIESRRSASSLVCRFDPPLRAERLAWSWRTDTWPAGTGALGEKAGDDFSLRLYLFFDHPLERVPIADRLLLRLARGLHDPRLPAASLCYVADPRAPAETLLASPYTARVQVLVIRSAPAPGPWWTQERDIPADFRRAFGVEHGPGTPALTGVALAADTDQGGGALNAWFSDLRWTLPG